MSHSRGSCPSPFRPGEARRQLPSSPLPHSSLPCLHGTVLEKNTQAAMCAVAVPQLCLYMVGLSLQDLTGTALAPFFFSSTVQAGRNSIQLLWDLKAMGEASPWAPSDHEVTSRQQILGRFKQALMCCYSLCPI